MNGRAMFGGLQLTMGRFPAWIAAMALCCGMLACQGGVLTYQGKTAAPGEEIPLSEGSHTGEWRTGDLTVNYTYTKSSDQLQLAGVITFADRIAYNFQSIISFNLQVFLLGDGGVVLQSSGAATGSSYADSQSSLSFGKTLDLPPAAAAMAFGYTGEARATGEPDEEGSTSFFHVPVQR